MAGFQLPRQYTGCGFLAIVIFMAFVMLLFFLVYFVPWLQSERWWQFAVPGGGGGGAGGGGGGANTVTYRGSDQSGDIPIISARDFIDGSSTVTSTGTLTLGNTVTLDEGGGFADGIETTIAFGAYPEEGVLLAFSTAEGNAGLGLNVVSGDWMAVYQGQGCSWEVIVAPDSVSGRISCTDIPTYNQVDGSTGSISLELDFSANSVPLDGESVAPGAEETPTDY